MELDIANNRLERLHLSECHQLSDEQIFRAIKGSDGNLKQIDLRYNNKVTTLLDERTEMYRISNFVCYIISDGSRLFKTFVNFLINVLLGERRDSEINSDLRATREGAHVVVLLSRDRGRVAPRARELQFTPPAVHQWFAERDRPCRWGREKSPEFEYFERIELSQRVTESQEIFAKLQTRHNFVKTPPVRLPIL